MSRIPSDDGLVALAMLHEELGVTCENCKCYDQWRRCVCTLDPHHYTHTQPGWWCRNWRRIDHED